MSGAELRDHATMILQAIASDIETDQTSNEEEQKSKGKGPALSGGESAASTHGTMRQDSGFTLVQVTAEYRALRASVLRLWLRQITNETEASFDDMLRFNEAIDQALAESGIRYSDKAARTREMLFAVLGHDLRSPLH